MNKPDTAGKKLPDSSNVRSLNSQTFSFHGDRKSSGRQVVGRKDGELVFNGDRVSFGKIESS